MGTVNLRSILSILAGLLYVVGFVPYIRAILRKEAQPAKASWIIWASLDTITLAGMIAKHAVNGLIIGALIGAWMVVILALKYGKSGWTRLDQFCLGGAVLGVALWGVSGNPTFGIVTSLGVVFLSSFPTFASAWNDPSKEDRTAWTIFFISCVVAMFAIPAWTLADAAQPVMFLAIEAIMVFILYWRPLTQRLPQSLKD
jgi:hypothetical protein